LSQQEALRENIVTLKSRLGVVQGH